MATGAASRSRPALRHGRGKRFVDVSESAVYWYFVVLSWIPIWAILYLVPRLG